MGAWLTTFAQILRLLPEIVKTVQDVAAVVPSHQVQPIVMHAAEKSGVPAELMPIVSEIVDHHTRNVLPAALLPPRLQQADNPAAEPCDHPDLLVNDVLQAAKTAEPPHVG